MCYYNLMFNLDTTNIDKFQRELKFFGRNIYPKSQGSALNKAAYETQQRYKMAVRRKFTLRNQHTERSIRYQKVKGLNPRSQHAVVGSTADYMLDQEFGTTIKKTGKHGVSIPTTVASGEGEGARPRRKVVRRPLRRGSIRLENKRLRAKSKRQFIVAAVRATAAKGGRNKFVYLPLDKHPGIYQVLGGKSKPRIRLLHDLSKPSVVIHARRPLKQSVDAIAPRVPGYFIQAAKFHLSRL